jgi:hypothetical protein
MKKVVVAWPRVVSLVKWRRPYRLGAGPRRHDHDSSASRSSRDATHWHLRGRGPGAGTVEVHLLEPERTIEIMVHRNGEGIWAGAALRDLAAWLSRKFGPDSARSRTRERS